MRGLEFSRLVRNGVGGCRGPKPLGNVRTGRGRDLMGGGKPATGALVSTFGDIFLALVRLGERERHQTNGKV